MRSKKFGGKCNHQQTSSDGELELQDDADVGQGTMDVGIREKPPQHLLPPGRSSVKRDAQQFVHFVSQPPISTKSWYLREFNWNLFAKYSSTASVVACSRSWTATSIREGGIACSHRPIWRWSHCSVAEVYIKCSRSWLGKELYPEYCLMHWAKGMDLICPHWHILQDCRSSIGACWLSKLLHPPHRVQT